MTAKVADPRPGIGRTGSAAFEPLTIGDLVAEARACLSRLSAVELAASTEALVLDTRTPTDRALYGCIPGSVHAPRTVLEWRVALDSPLRLRAIVGFDQLLVVVCNEGCSSSLAAVNLQRLGFYRATDLVGGVSAWIDAGLATVRPEGDEIGVQWVTASQRRRRRQSIDRRGA